METTLLFVRHGESDANEIGAFAGHWDVDLTQRGRQQAELTARYIRENFRVDGVYSSDLRRACDTAQPIARAFGLEVQTTERLREIYAGEWEEFPFDRLEEAFGEDFVLWRNEIEKSRPTNGESVAEMADRVWGAVEEICAENPGKTLVIVTHGTPVRMLLCRLQGLDLEHMRNAGWASNASVTVGCLKDDRWELIRAGIDDHLAQLKTNIPSNV